MNELEGKTIIVTGGAGALGTAIVAALIDAGARVAVPYLGEASYAKLRETVANERVSGAEVDLLDEDAVDRFFASVAARSSIDGLVCAAGGWAGGKPVAETPWKTWESMLDVNLKTAVIASKAAASRLRGRGGAIVHVASRAAVVAGPSSAAYSVSKRALLALTESLAVELAHEGVSVNAILPSLIDTPANRAHGLTKGAVAPEAIAKVVRFLIGPNGRIVSGAAIPVYGLG